ncbi:MAG: flavodoxin family protein [Firmicutes bacterium]|nr:flavodoxin family protein [Bacillota bacterium]
MPAQKDTILAISSSPRRHGNSELLLQFFVRALEKKGLNVSSIRVNDLNIRPCQACDSCAKTGECILKDDMQSIYPRVAAARAMVLASPIYFGTLSGQLKIFIDRFQCWWQAKYQLKKPKVTLEMGKLGYFISVGAMKKKEYCEDALKIAKIYYHNINYHYYGSLCYRGIDEKGAILKKPDALQEAYTVGELFAEEILSRKSNA